MPLDDAVRAGATLFGRPVARVVITYDDGRKAAFDLPHPAGELTPTQVRVLALLRAAPEPMERKAVAARLGRTTTGKFGQQVRDLLSRGMIFESGGALTDDPRKFPEPT